MVARIGLRRLDARAKKVMNRIIGTLERMRRDAEEIVELDPKVYQEVMNSYKRLKGANHQELAKAEVEKALTNSFRLQVDLALLAAMAKEVLTQVNLFAKGSIANDLIVAGGLLDGAFKGAAATARINVVYMKRGKNRSHCELALRKVEERFKKIRFG
jgi:formiminotetrahydrofolate cyclodeaminase